MLQDITQSCLVLVRLPLWMMPYVEKSRATLAKLSWAGCANEAMFQGTCKVQLLLMSVRRWSPNVRPNYIWKCILSLKICNMLNLMHGTTINVDNDGILRIAIHWLPWLSQFALINVCEPQMIWCISLTAPNLPNKCSQQALASNLTQYAAYEQCQLMHYYQSITI